MDPKRRKRRTKSNKLIVTGIKKFLEVIWRLVTKIWLFNGHSCDVYIISKKIHLYPGHFLTSFQIFLNIVLNVIRGYDCQFKSSSKRIILRWKRGGKGHQTFFTFFFSFCPFFVSFFWQRNLFLSSLSNDVTFFESRYKKGDKTKTNKQKDCT